MTTKDHGRSSSSCQRHHRSCCWTTIAQMFQRPTDWRLKSRNKLRTLSHATRLRLIRIDMLNISLVYEPLYYDWDTRALRYLPSGCYEWNNGKRRRIILHWLYKCWRLYPVPVLGKDTMNWSGETEWNWNRRNRKVSSKDFLLHGCRCASAFSWCPGAWEPWLRALPPTSEH